MKHKFVMDENTVALACSLQDSLGVSDFTCAHLWLNIAENCHRIVVNDYLLKGYYKRVKETRTIGLNVVRIINYLMANSAKFEFLTHSPAYSWTDKLPSDDVPIVLLAVQSGSILVTSDSRLRQSLYSLSVPQISSLRVLEPKDAVPLSLTR